MSHRHAPMTLLISVLTLLTTPAVAVEIALDELRGGTDDLDTCGVHVTASGSLGFDFGLGVLGGYSSALDGSERVEFEFETPQIGVYFFVNAVNDLDGDGILGRALVEAFDAAGASMGLRVIDHWGTKDMTDLFGPAPLSRVAVVMFGDALKIGKFGYTEFGSVELDLENGGYLAHHVEDPTICDVAFSGSDAVWYEDFEGLGFGGLGIYGGFSERFIDGFEWLRMEFPYPVDELVIESELDSLDGDFWYGEAVLYAYDEDGIRLGWTRIQDHSLFGGPIQDTTDVVAELGFGGISEILIVSDGDARRLRRVRYAPEATVGSGALLIALAGLARRRGRRHAIPRGTSSPEGVR